MHFRCFLWPNNLPNHLTCKCGNVFFSPSLSQPFHFSLSVKASKSYCFSVKTMPLADSDSDTDWNAQAKILPVRSSSSTPLPHSPHNTSYARNSSQKNFHSKTDHCTRKNTEKPPLRSLRSVARSINNPVSRNLFSPAETAKSQKSISTFNSKIDKIERTENMKPLPLKSGHNSRTCPEKQKREFELKSAQQILKCSVPAVAVVKGAENDVSDDQQLNASSVSSSSSSENSNFCCPFCKKMLQIHEMVENFCFQSLFSSSLADVNSDTLEKLQKLHPQENFKCSKPEVCPFWIENPITAIEVLKAIQKLPKGKAAGPSGISFDLLKIACSSAPEIADDLAHYFQQLIVLKINPPFELLAARLIALVKPGNEIKPDGIRPIAVGESLSRLLASIVFDRVKDKASTFLNPHQFGIKTIDGASVAAIASDTFF
ncbi:hypothetical protein P9112_004979 [Eukaryota sp. TZLM1-RC]